MKNTIILKNLLETMNWSKYQIVINHEIAYELDLSKESVSKIPKNILNSKIETIEIGPKEEDEKSLAWTDLIQIKDITIVIFL